jgi:hypothetical protein
VNAPYQSGSGTKTLTFSYTVAAGNEDTDGIAIGSAIALNSGTIKDAANNNAVLTLPTVNSSGILVNAINAGVPSLSSITSTTANGSYGLGGQINLTLTFSKSVILAGGNLILTLDTGATINIPSFSGTTASATYTVAAGQSSSDLNVTNIALASGATLKDTSGNAAILTLPTGANSLAGSKAIAIDGIVPNITNITSTTANGTYGIGSNINLTVNFSESVTLSGGNLVLTLDSGATVNLTNVNGTSASVTYTVGTGQNSSDLTVKAIALSSGATLKDSTGNTVNLALPTGLNTLAGSKAIVVDGVAPVIAPQYTGFATQTTFAAGTNPKSISTGDFNGDGKLDLAIANKGSSTVSVLLGLGSGSFSSQTTFAVGADPNSISVGDFNGDSKQDLAIANYSANSVSILIGTGNGSFNPQSTVAVGTNPNTVSIGDFNGDSRMDLAIANYTTNTVSILLGNGNGSFGARTTFATGTNPSAIAMGDFNGDSKADLAIANYGSNRVSILLGNGNGSFSAQTTFATGTRPSAITIADFNGDSRPDLAIANNSSGNVSILLGAGSGSFSAQSTFAAGANPSAIRLGDFNGDSKPDLAIANYATKSVSVLLGAGNGSFGTQLTAATGSNPSAVGVGDFNGDGQSDLAIANYNASANSVSILLNSPTPAIVLPPNATYTAGQVLSFTINFSEAVIVTGTPVLPMTIGSSSVNATYQSGTGTSALVFNYTVVAGNVDSDGITLGNALTLGGGTIRDSIGNNAVLTLPAVNTAGILVNAIGAPTISSMTSTTANGTYGVGSIINLTLNFSTSVTLAGGNLVLTLDNGATVNVTSFSGTTATASYTVAAGQNSADLNVTAIALAPGATLRNGSVNAVLTLPVGVNSLAGSKAIVIDTIAPAISSIISTTINGAYGLGSAIDITVNFSEAVTLAGGGLNLTLDTGATLTVNSINGTKASAIYTVAAGQNSNDLNVTTITLGSGATLKDVAGNAVNLTLPTGVNSLAGSKAIAIDSTVPTISTITSTTANGTYGVGSAINLTVNFSEAVNLAGGNLILTLSSGATVSLTSISGTSATGTYTVTAGQSSSDLNVTNIALASGATLKDIAGNNLSLALPTGGNSLAGSKAIVIETIAPTLTSITSTTANGTYGVGSSINLTANFSEAITLAGGSIVLTLNNGATVNLTNVSGTSLSGTYTIASGQSSTGLNVSAIARTIGATLKDAAGNDASLTVPAGANNLAGSKTIVVDATLPTLTSITSPTPSGRYAVGASIEIVLNFSEPLSLVGGNLILTLDSGTSLTIAPFTNGTKATAIYTIAAGDRSSDLNITTLALASGATLKDSAGNNTILTIPAGQSLKDNAAFIIGRTAPVISGTPSLAIAEGSPYSFSPSASDADGDSLNFTITNKPTWATFDPQTGKLSGTPADANVGTTKGVTISVSDGVDTVSLAAFDLTVTNVGEQPGVGTPTVGTPIVVPAEQQPIATQPFSFTLPAKTFTDPDGAADPLNLSATLANGSSLPDWLKFDPRTATFSGTPDLNSVGDLSLKVIATDRQGNLVSQTFSLAIATPTGLMGIPTTPIKFSGGKRGVSRSAQIGKPLQGTAGSDVLRGTAKNDRIKSGKNSDKKSKDKIYGKAGNDRLTGGGGDDYLSGDRGNDTLSGGRGRDLLLGGLGNDKLLGSDGQDILIGGLGIDKLTGGKDKDMFTFDSIGDGLDTITDFNAQEDVIDLRKLFTQPQFSGATPYLQYLQYVKMVQVGTAVEIQIDADGNGSGSSLTPLVSLQNQTLSALGSRNIVIGQG